MSKKILLFLACGFLVAIAIEKTPLIVSPEQISIPQALNYQGKLTNVSGNSVPDSTYSLTFRFFPTLTGGTAIWTETQSVQTHSGLFNCLLGNVTSITSIPLDGNCYLEMQVNPNPAMTPRIRIVSSAYSFLAKKADTANYATNAPLTRPITPPVATNEIDDGAVNSAKILDGSITRTDVASNFKSPYSDTADYARAVNAQYVDSSRISANTHRLQGKDTLALSVKFVDEGQTNAISNIMIIDNAVTNTKISDGTITRADVANNFKAPFSDTSDYARAAPLTRPITPAVATNEIADDAINSAKILDGSISRQDVTNNFKSPYSDTADYARAVNVQYADSSRIAANAHKLQGKDTIALSTKFVDEGQANAISTTMIVNGSINTLKLADSAVNNQKLADNAVISSKILNGTIIRDDVANNFKAPYSDTSDYARGAPLARPITPAITTNEIADDAVNSAKVLDGTISGTDISTPLTLQNSLSFPNAVLHIKNTGTGRGISIDSAGFGGLSVNYAFTDGVNIGYALQYGVYVDTAGGDGMFISNTGIDGIGINNAGWDGLYITYAGINGVEVTDVATDGIYIMHAGDNGIRIDSAESYGVFAHGNIAAGNFIASNASANGLIVHAYNNTATDTAMKIYGESYATGGFYTGGLFGDKSAPCLISPELGIVSAGTGMLTNGRAEINFDPLFAENIRADIPIRITVTPKGKPAGFIYITETKSSGFKVELEPIPGLEKNTTDITFDWIAFGTLKEHQTSPEAQAQWQKMLRERDAKRAEAKTRNQERNRMLEQHK